MTKELIIFFIAVLSFSPLQIKAQNLSEIYALALENDPQLKQVAAKQLATDEIKIQSNAKFFPTVKITGIKSRVVENNNNEESAVRAAAHQVFWDNLISLNVTQPLFHWDYWIGLSQSENKVAQAEASYQAEFQNLIIKTATAYFKVLAAEDNLKFILIEKQAIAQQLEQAKLRFDAGIIAITDVYEAQAGYDQSLAGEIAARNKVDDEKEALKEIIGDNLVQLNPLNEQLPLIKPKPDDIKNWSDMAESSNFSIIAALNQTEIARKSIELQESGHLPQLDLVASYNGIDNTGLYGYQGNSANIGVHLNVPLYEGGAVNSRTRQASYEYEAAKEQLIAVKRAVNRQVRDAYRGIISSISQVTALNTTVQSAENALSATQAGFEAGTRTMVDVLHEQRNLYQAKRNLALARYDYLLNGIKLKQAASNLTSDDIQHIDSLLSKSAE
jgi:outer membrane protein